MLCKREEMSLVLLKSNPVILYYYSSFLFYYELSVAHKAVHENSQPVNLIECLVVVTHSHLPDLCCKAIPLAQNIHAMDLVQNQTYIPSWISCCRLISTLDYGIK